MVEGRLTIERIGSSSVEMCVALHGAPEEGEAETKPRALIRLVNVHVDLESGRPQPVPDALRARLKGRLPG